MASLWPSCRTRTCAGPGLRGFPERCMAVTWKRRRRGRRYSLFAFAVPAVALYSVFFVWPLVNGLYLSLTDWNGLARAYHFVGARNFTELLSDEAFLSSVGVTLKYAAFVASLQITIALGLALTLSSESIRFRPFLRTVFFLPNVMSTVIISVIWTFIFGNVFRAALKLVHLGNLPFSWLGDPRYAIYSLGIVEIWHGLGFYLIILLTGITAVPADVLEAASIDGASSWQRVFNITLPLLTPTIVTCSILSVASSLRAFEIPFIITSGGPGFSTTTLAYFIYRTAFESKQFGYGSAAAFYMFIGIMVITLMQLRVMQRKGVEY